MNTSDFAKTFRSRLEEETSDGFLGRVDMAVYEDQILVSYFNIDKKPGQINFGVDGLNNRAMFEINPMRNGKYKFSTSVWSFDFDWLKEDHRVKRARGKTATPEKVIEYLVKTILNIKEVAIPRLR